MPALPGAAGPSTFPPPVKPAPRRPVALFCAGFLVMAVAAGIPMGMTAPHVNPSQSAHLTVPVHRGMVEVTLAQRGLLGSARNIVVASECEWTTRIISLVPEGTWVEDGDIVVELDASELRERLKEREIQLIEAESELIQAQQVLDMQELENQSGLAKATLALQLARLDLQKYENGEFPKTEKEAKAALALAEEDVTRSRERCKYVSRLVHKGYESPVTLEKERIELLKYENRLASARREVDVLVEHTYPRTMAELQGTLEAAEYGLGRVEKISRIAILNRQVQVHTRKTKRDAALAYVERLRKSIVACTIRSPATGDIIYANEGSVRNEIVEGEEVRNRQEVVRIPDLTQMTAKLRIHESLIDGIRQGLPVKVRIDAYPEMELAGRVESVSRLPTSGKDYNYDLKEYDATVRINATAVQRSILKPGLTAQVQILVDRQPDCLSVPPQSVVDIAGRHVVFVQTPIGIEHREVEVGLRSDVAVEVRAGLSESDQVLLSPRTNCSSELMALRERFNSESDVANIGG